MDPSRARSAHGNTPYTRGPAGPILCLGLSNLYVSISSAAEPRSFPAQPEVPLRRIPRLCGKCDPPLNFHPAAVGAWWSALHSLRQAFHVVRNNDLSGIGRAHFFQI